jgi:hypothetical protein
MRSTGRPGLSRQLYLVQYSPIAFSTVILKCFCDIFIQYLGIEIAVLMDEEESAAAQKFRLLVFLHEAIFEVKVHAQLRKEVHAIYERESSRETAFLGEGPC